MEQNDNQNQNSDKLSQKYETVLKTKPESGYFTRLFSGRMNRQNYIIGSTVFVLVPLLCFLVVIFNILLSSSAFAMSYINPNNPGEIITPQVSIASLLTMPNNELWTALG